MFQKDEETTVSDTIQGVLAHFVERNASSVEVSGSSPLYSTQEANLESYPSSLFRYYAPTVSPTLTKLYLEMRLKKIIFAENNFSET